MGQVNMYILHQLWISQWLGMDSNLRVTHKITNLDKQGDFSIIFTPEGA